MKSRPKEQPYSHGDFDSYSTHSRIYTLSWHLANKPQRSRFRLALSSFQAMVQNTYIHTITTTVIGGWELPVTDHLNTLLPSRPLFLHSTYRNYIHLMPTSATNYFKYISYHYSKNKICFSLLLTTWISELAQHLSWASEGPAVGLVVSQGSCHLWKLH